MPLTAAAAATSNGPANAPRRLYTAGPGATADRDSSPAWPAASAAAVAHLAAPR